jgi:hypothetical protein
MASALFYFGVYGSEVLDADTFAALVVFPPDCSDSGLL